MEVIRDKRCEECGGKCCKIMLLEGPDKGMTFDQDWLFLHDTDRVWVDGQYFWMIRHPCRQLLADGTCATYEGRPDACRYFPIDAPQCAYARRMA